MSAKRLCWNHVAILPTRAYSKQLEDFWITAITTPIDFDFNNGHDMTATKVLEIFSDYI
ncbi:MAG: hypothetical protein ACI8ZB_000266 [Desulforhopalus sp.]|jgi:hypothetical protein